MIKNYFSIAWRNMVRHKVYSCINVAGLAMGICACIVIYLITSYEFSFDTFHEDGDRIYRVTGTFKRTNGEMDFLNSVVPEVAGIEHDIPGFEAKAPVYFYDGPVTIRRDALPPAKFDNKIPGTHTAATAITTSQYFDIFKYTWLAGNPKTALNEPFKVVLTENRAHEYFGKGPVQEMIGKTVIYEDSLAVTVSGIVKDWNKNSDFGFTGFLSLATATRSFMKNFIPTEDWSSLRPHGSMAFVKLNKKTSAAHINALLAAYAKTHAKAGQYGILAGLKLQPLNELHFTREFHRVDDGDDFRKAHLPTLYVLMGVALFILVIAAVNFVNLSTAQSIRRAKEIGVRKVMGGNRTSIIIQFLTETGVLTIVAVIVAALLVKPVLRAFSDYIPQGVQFHAFSAGTLIFLLLVAVITALLAGLYPAWVLSGYLPVLTLKGTALQNTTGKFNSRKALIIFQFTISLVFIISAIVISRQIHYMNKADKGFDTNAVITLWKWGPQSGKLKQLAEAVKRLPGIDKVILQGKPPMGAAQTIDTYKYKGARVLDLQPHNEIGNEDYISFYNMKLIAGRNVLHSDSLRELLINETFSKTLGFAHPREAIGKVLYRQTGANTEQAYPIVGVIADYHTDNFHQVIPPVVIEYVPEKIRSLAIKLSAGEKNVRDVKATLAQVEVQWKKLFPDSPFEYNFLNETITWLFAQEEKTAWLINVAVIITIFISGMGLFGLMMFTTELKTREIGIRKVLGATVIQITTLLCKEFILLIVITIFIASPIAWYFMHHWLQDFAYRIHLSWWMFALAGAAAILIALITISFQSIKAAVANPIVALRNE
jgi:putative ABC transport system permease protein